MNSSKPYILRALHQWITDNDCTPLILVSSKNEEIQIPAGIEEEGKVVLNISYGATKNFEITDDGVYFDARFSGVSQNLYVPTSSILAIYARENGQGMMFGESDDEPPNTPAPQTKSSAKKEKLEHKPKSKDKNFLKVVK
jgi:stringent starvation protein B